VKTFSRNLVTEVSLAARNWTNVGSLFFSSINLVTVTSLDF
jgi:hypothetical protein